MRHCPLVYLVFGEVTHKNVKIFTLRDSSKESKMPENNLETCQDQNAYFTLPYYETGLHAH